jgi:hypothetical protein
VVHLFLSYSREDKELANDLEQWLRECEVFLDVGVEDGISVGSEWEDAIYQALKDADGIVVLVTQNSIESKWCFAEITIARLLGKEILPIMGEAEAVHPLLSGISHANFATERQRADTRLARELVTCGAFTPEGDFLELPEFDMERLLVAWQEAVFTLYLAEDKIEPDVVENMRTWQHSGFSVDQYMTRCPFSLSRLIKVSDMGDVDQASI